MNIKKRKGITQPDFGKFFQNINMNNKNKI